MSDNVNSSAATSAVGWSLAAAVWIVAYAGLAALLGLLVVAGAPGLTEGSELARDAVIGLWGGGSMVVATRLAARVGVDRVGERIVWIAALPVAVVVADIARLGSGAQTPLVLGVAGLLGIAGSIAAVTWWPLPATGPRSARRS